MFQQSSTETLTPASAAPDAMDTLLEELLQWSSPALGHLIGRWRRSLEDGTANADVVLAVSAAAVVLQGRKSRHTSWRPFAMNQPTSDAVLRAANDAAGAHAAAVARAQDESRLRPTPFNTESWRGLTDARWQPVPDPETLQDTAVVTLSDAVNLPVLTYSPLSRQYERLSRVLTTKAIAELERQLAAATDELARLPHRLAHAGQAEVDARAARDQAHSDLVAAYNAEWGAVDVQWGADSITSTTLIVAPDSPMRSGRPLSETVAWRRARALEERLGECQREVTRLSVRQSDLTHSVGVWQRRLSELRANLEWHDARNRELGLPEATVA